MEWGNTLLDDFVLGLTGRERARRSASCRPPAAMPTTTSCASTGRSRPSRCEPSHISLFRRETGVGDPRAHLLAQDLIYVGGGSLVSLLGHLAGARDRRDPARGVGGRRDPVRRLGRRAVLVRARAERLPRGPGAARSRRSGCCRGAAPSTTTRSRAGARASSTRSAAGCRPATAPATRRRCTSSAPSWPRSSPRVREAQASFVVADARRRGASSASCRCATSVRRAGRRASRRRRAGRLT